jgi:hypothetical protein
MSRGASPLPIASLRAPIFLLVILVAELCSAQDVPRLRSKNAGEYVAFAQVRIAHSLVDYCAEAVPEMKSPLDAAYTHLLERAGPAIAPSLKRIPTSAALSAPVSSELVQAYRVVENAGLDAVRTMKPREACSQILRSIEGRTSEELRARSEETMQYYVTFYQARNHRHQ